MSPPHIIHLRRDAPPQPALGQPCNGCGVCCAYAPCPLGVVVSGRRRGRCRALAWDGARYVCGMLQAPRRHWRWLPRTAEPLVRVWVRRLIASGVGCDAHLETMACQTQPKT